MKKPKTYLTPEMVKQMKEGETYHLGYDDFNKGKMQWVFQKCAMEQGPFGDRLTCVGRDVEGNFDHKFYQFDGPHRDGSVTPVMVSGSGAERIYFTKGVIPCIPAILGFYTKGGI